MVESADLTDTLIVEPGDEPKLEDFLKVSWSAGREFMHAEVHER